MDTNTILALQEAGVDTEGAVRRFSGNTALYERFLNKFLTDPTFDKVTESFDKEDTEEAILTTHTFKGLTANLGLNTLFEISSEMVSQLRAGKFKEASESYPKLKEAYDSICDILSRG